MFIWSVMLRCVYTVEPSPNEVCEGFLMEANCRFELLFARKSPSWKSPELFLLQPPDFFEHFFDIFDNSAESMGTNTGYSNGSSFISVDNCLRLLLRLILISVSTVFFRWRKAPVLLVR